jgi:DMSO/TMAO reductase YedYZ molybdopterin-dependent catalytic subunit
VLLGLDHPHLFPENQHSLRDSKLLGQVEFLNEGHVQMDAPFGEELDGRLYTSFGDLTDSMLTIPTERFYLRTRASKILPKPDTWTIAVDGLLTAPRKLGIHELQTAAKPLGRHLMECAGNTRATHFGMISVGEFAGLPLGEILAAKAKPEATQILVSGFDRYAGSSATSTPGASWIFKLDEILKANAFLATELNGTALSPDHGAPVRLVVPGWYGCCCIKWVDRIALVDDRAEATSQMLEYATRTHQDGSPRLARDFRAARVEHAAMPIRVEKRLEGDSIVYRVVGMLWGGSESIRQLAIRFNPEEEYVPVDWLPTPQTAPWTLWSHRWKPAVAGSYTIRLAIKEPTLHPKRLESGYYARSVEISEV